MEEIFSEGQRRERQKHVSLPYHRPKQRSLDDFLHRRNLVTAVPLRTSVDKLKEVWKQMEEKEKDAEIFYKSEDESEDDYSDEDYCPDKEKNQKSGKTESVAASSSENDLNLANTTEKKEKSSAILSPSEGEFPPSKSPNPPKSNSDAYSPLTENRSPSPNGTDCAKNMANVEKEESPIELLLHLSEEFTNGSSVPHSQPADSSEFSLKLSELSEARGLDGTSVGSSTALTTEETTVPDEKSSDESKLPDLNNSSCKSVCEKQEDFSKDKETTSSGNEPKLDEALNDVNLKTVSEEKEAFCKEKDNSLSVNEPKRDKDLETVNPKIDCEKKDDSCEEKEASVDEPKVDKVMTLGVENETAQQFAPVKDSSDIVDNFNTPVLPGKSDESGKDELGEKESKIKELLPESDPTFNLHLEESQDDFAIPTTENRESKEGNTVTETSKDEGKKVPDDEIDWTDLKGFSDDEFDFEPAPKISLKRSSEDIIVLDEPIPRRNPGLEQLMEKFLKHSSYKVAPKKKQPVLLNVVTTSKNKDNVINGYKTESFTISADEESKNEKPGARLSKLQTELKIMMAKHRQEEWKKRLQEQKMDEEELEDGEKSECGGALDDDDDFGHISTESEDSDLEENDIDVSDKKKTKSAFVDDEAEEDEDEEEDADASEKEGEESDEDNEVIKGRKKTVSVEEEKYEGDDEEGCEDDNNDDNNDDKECDEDDGWTLGQTKLRSQFTQPAIDPTPNFVGLDDSKFDASFELSKLGSFSESELNLSERHDVGGIEDLINVKNPGFVTESQVLGLCSGQFQTQPPQIEDEDDNFVMSPTQEKSQSQNQTQKKFDALLSSDEEGERELTISKKKKVVLQFSDDENETVDSKEETVEKESNEDEDEEQEEGEEELDSVINEDEDNQSVMYDSEENEIVVTKKDVGKFFDKEAELSESDWDSEDEDEKGLDKMDEELGDREDIDQDEVQKQLGKIHMRQLLDDDQRDIKLLQERFLEDGELHSEGGREKNFRWQNINSAALKAWSERRDSDDEEPEEEEERNAESEELWQKMRAEREAFLKKNKNVLPKNDEDLDEAINCEFLQRCEKIKESSIKHAPSKMIDLDEPIIKKAPTAAALLQATNQHLFVNKGSFLVRSSQILSRVGPVVVSGGEANLNKKAKNNRNFVFAAKSPTKEISEDSQDSNLTSKRKLAPSIPEASKKPRFMEEKKIEVSNRKSFLAQLNFN